MRFRRFAYSASITGTVSMLPVIAANAAYWAIDVGFDVDWLCSLISAWISGAGPRVYPMRQPVIANVFDTDPMMMTFSFESFALAIENGLFGSYVKCE